MNTNRLWKNILCGFARVDGWAVGIVANQRKTVKTKKGEMQMGGVIYSDSADKLPFYYELHQRKCRSFSSKTSVVLCRSKADAGG